MNDLSMPSNLDKKGIEAYKTIMSLVKKHSLEYTGGCKCFYSPTEWQARGEEYGINSKLIIVYDGAIIRELFYPNYGSDLMQECVNELSKIGLFFEPCTSWYSAVYEC